MSRSASLAGLLGFLATVAVALVTAAPAAAHDATTTAYAEVTGSDQDVRAVLELEYDLLMKSAWLYAEAYQATDPVEQRRQLEANADAVASYALDRFQVAYDDQRCTGSFTGVPQLTERNGRAFAVLALDYRCTGGPGGSHALFSALFPDQENFVHSTKTLVHYQLEEAEGSAVLEAGRPQHQITDAPSGSTITADSSTGSHLGGFVVLGGEHLLLGPDHLLFLVALLIGSRGLRDVVVTATTFTAAHSVTFLMAALGVVDVPPGIVEPLIALSIVAVAMLHLVRHRVGGRTTTWRVPLVFAFGLLHGLGFAGALGIDGRWSWRLLASLIAFNVGLELAQLALVVLLFPLVLLRRTAVGNTVMLAATVVVGAVGLLWFIERLPFGTDLAAAMAGWS